MGRKVVSGDQGSMGRMWLEEVEFCANDWDIQETANEEDTSNTCGGGHAEQEFGVKRLEGTINATWDAAKNIYQHTPVLTVGRKFNCRLYPNHPTGNEDQDLPHYDFTLQVGSGVQVTVPVKGKVEITLPFMSHGIYTLPTNAVSSGA